MKGEEVMEHNPKNKRYGGKSRIRHQQLRGVATPEGLAWEVVDVDASGRTRPNKANHEPSFQEARDMVNLNLPCNEGKKVQRKLLKEKVVTTLPSGVKHNSYRWWEVEIVKHYVLHNATDRFFRGTMEHLYGISKKLRMKTDPVKLVEAASFLTNFEAQYALEQARDLMHGGYCGEETYSAEEALSLVGLDDVLNIKQTPELQELVSLAHQTAEVWDVAAEAAIIKRLKGLEMFNSNEEEKGEESEESNSQESSEDLDGMMLTPIYTHSEVFVRERPDILNPKDFPGEWHTASATEWNWGVDSSIQHAPAYLFREEKLADGKVKHHLIGEAPIPKWMKVKSKAFTPPKKVLKEAYWGYNTHFDPAKKEGPDNRRFIEKEVELTTPASNFFIPCCGSDIGHTMRWKDRRKVGMSIEEYRQYKADLDAAMARLEDFGIEARKVLKDAAFMKEKQLQLNGSLRFRLMEAIKADLVGFALVQDISEIPVKEIRGALFNKVKELWAEMNSFVPKKAKA